MSPAIQHVSRALRQSLLALLGGKVSSHAARRLALCSENWKRARGTPSLVQRGSPRADADAHAGAVANATMPRHRHATLSVRERAVGVPFATARAIPPASTLERGSCCPTRLYARTLSCALSASQPRRLRRLGRELALRARKRHRVCRLLFELRPTAGTVFRRAVRPASRRRRQSVLERQPRPASVRCAHHRGTGWRAGPDSTT